MKTICIACLACVLPMAAMAQEVTGSVRSSTKAVAAVKPAADQQGAAETAEAEGVNPKATGFFPLLGGLGALGGVAAAGVVAAAVAGGGSGSGATTDTQ